MSRQHRAVRRAARLPSRYWARWVAARSEACGVSRAVTTRVVTPIMAAMSSPLIPRSARVCGLANAALTSPSGGAVSAAYLGTTVGNASKSILRASRAAHEPKCGHGVDTTSPHARVVSSSLTNFLYLFVNLVGAPGLEPGT